MIGCSRVRWSHPGEPNERRDGRGREGKHGSGFTEGRDWDWDWDEELGTDWDRSCLQAFSLLCSLLFSSFLSSSGTCVVMTVVHEERSEVIHQRACYDTCNDTCNDNVSGLHYGGRASFCPPRVSALCPRLPVTAAAGAVFQLPWRQEEPCSPGPLPCDWSSTFGPVLLPPEVGAVRVEHYSRGCWSPLPWRPLAVIRCPASDAGTVWTSASALVGLVQQL